MVFDASPFGAGGFVSQRGTPCGWFATTWGEGDAIRPGVRFGNHRDQALAELYSILLGLRAWTSLWTTVPTRVLIKSDSLAALGPLEKGRSTRSPGMNLILKEIALVVAVSPTGLRYEPAHIRGDRNQWSDNLSRLGQPGSGARVPAPLLACPRASVENRVEDGYWLTAGVPAEVLQGEDVGM